MISTQTLQKEEVLVITYQKTKCNKAFGNLYEMFYQQLFDYINKFANSEDDAFDITQEAFIKAAQEIDKLKIPITFRFWLFRIAKNMVMKKYRTLAKNAHDAYQEDVVEQNYDITDAEEKEEQLVKMALILSQLTKEEQTLLIDKYANGKSIKEIMQSTNLGSSAIKMKLMRAKSKMVSGMNYAS